MRVLATGLVAVGTLLTGLACSDDSDGVSAAKDFCAEAERFMSDISGSAFLEHSTSKADQALERADDVDPPDEIADDWVTVVEGARAMREMDLGATSADSDFPNEVLEMGPASTNVYVYLADECGLEGLDVPMPPEGLPSDGA